MPSNDNVATNLFLEFLCGMCLVNVFILKILLLQYGLSGWIVVISACMQSLLVRVAIVFLFSYNWMFISI